LADWRFFWLQCVRAVCSFVICSRSRGIPMCFNLVYHVCNRYTLDKRSRSSTMISQPDSPKVKCRPAVHDRFCDEVLTRLFARRPLSGVMLLDGGIWRKSLAVCVVDGGVCLFDPHFMPRCANFKARARARAMVTGQGGRYDPPISIRETFRPSTTKTAPLGAMRKFWTRSLDLGGLVCLFRFC